MKNTLLTSSLLSCFTLFASVTASASVVVADWQFNTPGDLEGWISDGGSLISGLEVATAVGGTESVLTTTGLTGADVKIFFPNSSIDLPVGADSWGDMTIRIRQLDGSDNPVAFNTAHTNFAMLGSTGGGSTPWPVLYWDTGGGAVTVVQSVQADGWNIFTFDLSSYTSGNIKPKERMDPITGISDGLGGFEGNFEIDYVTITAVPSIPEPSTVALWFGSVMLAFVAYRKRK